MDLNRVAVSRFPRQSETPSDSLMTAFIGRSGQSEALSYSPGTDFGWRPYAILRLTCHSSVDRLTRQTASGSPGSMSACLDPVLLPMLGAFPLLVDNSHRFKDRRAPGYLESAVSWSTVTSVDSAGWTEVVIQEGRHVLSYVFVGPKAEVNASFDHVLGPAPLRGSRLVESGGIPSDNRTCGCTGPSDVNDSRFSCLSFNEVTK